MSKGWKYESGRHGLAARGIKSSFRSRGHPGKFEGCADEEIGEKLYDMVGESWQVEELGGVEDFGWYGLIIDTGIPDAPNAIVSEDNDGFFDYEAFDTEVLARQKWGKIKDEYYEFVGAYDEEPDSNYPHKEDTPSLDLPMERYTER